MVTPRTTPKTPRTTEAALDGPGQLDRILAAEREAEDAVAAEQIEAERRLEHARQQARRIAKRTEERVTRVRAACEERVEAELSQLRAEERGRAERAEDLEANLERQRAAIERVAAWLTAAPPGRDGGQEP